MSGLHFVIEAEHAPHLAAALDRHLRRLREGGIRAPTDILELTKWAQVVARGLSAPPALPDGEDGPVPQLLSLPEVAIELGDVSLSKVKKLIADGQLVAVDFDGVRRVRRSDLDTFVAGLAPRSFTESIQTKGAPASPSSRPAGRRAGATPRGASPPAAGTHPRGAA